MTSRSSRPARPRGLIIHGDKDAVVPAKDVTGLVEKLKTQKGIITRSEGDRRREPLLRQQDRAADAKRQAYLDKRLKPADSSAPKA